MPTSASAGGTGAGANIASVTPAAVGPRFITFEGIEGSGKSTQLRRLAATLETRGHDPLLTREPGGTPIGDQIRGILLHPASVLGPWSELFLYAAARAEHLEQVIRPALAAGRIVLCDRFTDATRAYQGHGRGLPLDAVESLHALGPLRIEPDRTLLFDLEPETALLRARGREAETADAADRFEREALAFHTRVRTGYLHLARRHPDRFRVIDAHGDVDTVATRVLTALGDLA